MSVANFKPAGLDAAEWTVVVAGLEAAATGLFLFVAPGLFGSLVLGGELSEAGDALGRLAGIALLSFAFACWPAGGSADQRRSMLQPMQLYNLLAMIYLIYLGMGGRPAGLLLWPAAGIHVVLSLLLARAWFFSDRNAIARKDKAPHK